MPSDPSNGYDAIADEFIAVRSASGRLVVEEWAASLPQGASVIDVGAGSGEPLTAALIEAGLTVAAIDASPKMIAAFRRRFPGAETACELAETSRFFDRKFDAALAVGLIFLLEPETQRALIPHLSTALEPGGRLLFSAPRQVCEWDDLLTGRRSWSLGDREYRALLNAAGLDVTDAYADSGGTWYYDAQKRP